MDETIKKAIENVELARHLARDNTEKSIIAIDRIIEEKGKDLLDVDFLRRAQEEGKKALNTTASFGKAAVLVPVGLFGLQEGLTAPDIDITLLGIGNHRYFLFHSAIGLAILRYFYTHWQYAEGQTMLKRFGQKVAGLALGSYAFGVGIHLGFDVIQPKSVVFPFFGSLIDGTLIDDRIWLMGNSLWAFKISHDIFALCMANELESAKAWVKDRFKGSDLNAVFGRN
jgi:hypothetical protein